ncbi:sensor histidine kinase [Sphingomonas baiyangensis]|uniref:histidine kinase n=1 Tax=Sphingomonas baiyangensis TaxID=2572576 RepID=A0A4U1L128_9SPHN|nr:HAMP domain-containing sensor histidine kinase [Sphingomonas baiyangensis]TKD50501.1 HAMP domain-containing histidine kinase [Sphingomonas baiyangensis]
MSDTIHSATSASARLDPKGRLVHADAPLVRLNAQAGGSEGAPLAVSAIAAIARLAQRLGIVVARSAVVADGDDDAELWVRASPDAEGVTLEVSGWHARDGVRTSSRAALAAAAPLDAADADVEWACDARMRITTAAWRDAGRPAPIGQALTHWLAFDSDSDGMLPLLAAAANCNGFERQDAVLREDGTRLRLSGRARRDAAGRFAGFVGVGHLIDAPPLPDAGTPSAFTDAFGERLERALRAPLARIVAHADSIGAQTEGPLMPEYVGYAQDIAGAARHLMGLVDDLVDLQAIERPDFAVAPEPIDLADVARRAAGLLAVRAQQAEVTIERPGFDDMLPATGDFRRALQILVNLIGNAVRYSPRGSSVTIGLSRDGPHARVTIADTGKGIAPADHVRVFEKFGRVDPSEPGGTGLGLYIARRLARAMAGDITLDSAAGQGARFTLSLPAGG